ncbi:MAG: SEC-C metal-binding domain-containing protein, partial [Streptosporangiaceae bacterium]
LARPQRAGSLSYSAPSDDASGRAQHASGQAGDGQFAGVGRNAPCPCGSGKKFKMCHGDPRNR